MPRSRRACPGPGSQLRRVPRRARRHDRRERRLPRRPLRAAPLRDGRGLLGRESTPEEQRARSSSCSTQSLAAGGLGLSTSRSTTHNDGDGQPGAQPVRLESRSSCRCATVVGRARGHDTRGDRAGLPRHGSTTTRSSCWPRMSATARRPLNWNVLSVSADEARASSSTSCARPSAPVRSAAAWWRSPCRSSPTTT